MTLDGMARLYIKEIMRLHGVPRKTISDRDSRLTSHFWKNFQKALGSELGFSIIFHLQTDGQSERTIRTLEDMLWACVLNFKESWEDQLPLIEFAYNNSYHDTIGMPPYEALYGRKCRSPIYWDEVGEKQVLGPDLVQDTVEKIKIIRKRMQIAQSRQKNYADTREGI